MKNTFKITFFLVFSLIFFSGSEALAVRSLLFGMSGSDVTALQNQLIAKGYLAAGKNTGYFGSLTEAALKKFQCEAGIVCSGTRTLGYGVYGPRTQTALSGSGSAAGSFEFSGWIPYWRSATGTQDVLPHLSQLKSVMPFVYTVKTNGKLNDAGDMDKEPWVSFIAAAKAARVRVVPTVMWGNGDAIHKILSNQKTRIALEDEIVNLVKKNNFDGIDIDFEAKKHETVNYFSTFLKGLYQRMGKKWVYCTVEARMPLEDRYLPGQTIPPDAQDYANDYAQMNKYCDRIEIMAYDQGTIDQRLNAVRQTPYAPVADPGWVEGLVLMVIKGGIATYGYEYKVTPLSNGQYQYQRLWAFNPRYATDIAAKLGITPQRNSAGELGFAYDASLLEPAPQSNAAGTFDVPPTGNEATQTQQQQITTTTTTQNAPSTSSEQADMSKPFNYFSWSDVQAIADKVTLAKRLGLRGVVVFKFDGGEDPEMWEVLK